MSKIKPLPNTLTTSKTSAMVSFDMQKDNSLRKLISIIGNARRWNIEIANHIFLVGKKYIKALQINSRLRYFHNVQKVLK